MGGTWYVYISSRHLRVASVFSPSSNLLLTAVLFQGRNLSTNLTGLFPYVYTAEAPDESPRHASVYEAINQVEDALSDMSTPTPATVLEWSPNDVQAYFMSLGFEPEVCSKFVEHKITGTILLELELPLLKELDIPSFGTRFELDKLIKSLRTAAQTPKQQSSHPQPPVQKQPTTPQQPYNKHTSVVQPLETEYRSRALPRDSVAHYRQRSQSLDDRDSRHRSGMPSFDKNWQLPSSPMAQSPAQSPIQSPAQSPPQQVTPLVPTQRTFAPYGNGSHHDSASAAIDETLDKIVNSPATGTFSSPQPERSMQPDLSRSSESPESKVRNSYLEESRQRALYQQQLHSPQLYEQDVEPMGDPHTDSPVAGSSSPATPYSQSNSSSMPPPLPTNSSSTTVHSSATNSIPQTPELPSMPYDGNLDSAALKARTNTGGNAGLGLSYANLTSSPRPGVGNRVISAPMSPSEKAEHTLRSASANAAKPKKLTKQQTSAFVEGRMAVTPSSAAATAEFSGWMSKRGGSGVGVWKNRFFTLHGTRLSYFATNDDQKERGLIDITAHKVVPVKANEDRLVSLYAASTGAGRYCFKLVPPAPGARKGVTFTAPKTHYFAVDSREDMRLWMNALMRATIDRDDTVPVISSCTTPTVSLAKAREMSLLAMEARAEELRMELPSTRTSSESPASSNVSTPELSMSEPRSEGESNGNNSNIEGFKDLAIAN
ncbi:hypothetical protein BZA70DRAFT_161928 [Myxozyma melibiosi]|uniref:PH domain-containing protein n=1 Tax=Myxozyma melibiosi TaxID=54550 RepID=A0ABR1F6Q8_9ASCO